MANEQLPGKQLSAHGAARRRFTRAGAAASGVLLTLHSQPGMAGAAACTTPSGFHSLTYGSHNPRVTTCSGLSPGIWTQSLTERGGKGNTPGHVKWPVDPDSTKFNHWFVCGPDTAQTLGLDSTSLRVVLENNQSWFDPNNLGRHMVAAYLNFLSNRSPVPTANTLVLIWNALRDHGEYIPNAGATPWDVEQVKAYLRSTMG